MLALPAVKPVTKPAASTDATALLLLPHVPPLIASASVVFVPVQIVVEPVIAVG